MKSYENLMTWSRNNNIDIKSLSKIKDMILLGKRGPRTSKDPVQFPEYYYSDSDAKPWHQPTSYDWVRKLEEAFQDIAQEASNIETLALFNPHPQNDELAKRSTWNTFFLYKNGKKFEDNCKQCPITTRIIESIPGTNIVGRVYFSMMGSGIHIQPHCGPHNFKLRCHLGITTPQKASMRVAEETRIWEEGKCLVFDDSFEHEVWNKSDSTRLVLIVDTWNPSLSKLEQKALTYIGIPSA
ncbi:MAG: aspartyl/asparaginyl beta-hydroxylase domain-containing protein [Rhizobiales bacterium]|nr:aspartyl/asparaginyl beta-hydroxylase domain-containing protein [Hyphomicrobiales bacterium]